MIMLLNLYMKVLTKNVIPINEVSRIEVWSDDWGERYNVFEF